MQQGTVSADVIATLTAMAPTATQVPPTAELVEGTEEVVEVTPEPTPIIVPASFALDGMGLEYQTMNNCGPANLSMNITFWGWPTNQKVTEDGLKTHVDDRNVMLSEMRVYAEENTDLLGVVRYGGDVEMIKRLLSAGFPVLLERGHTDDEDGWMGGHYSIIMAYDDATQSVQIPDTLLGIMTMGYAELERTGLILMACIWYSILLTARARSWLCWGRRLMRTQICSTHWRNWISASGR